MSFPRYESYKDSGVEWLNTIPSHWVDLPLKGVVSHNNDVLDERTAADYEILYVDISSVNPIVGIASKEAMPFSSAPSRARRRVKNGDVIVSTVRTYLRAIARINDPEENLVVSTGFCVVRPSSRVFHGFLGYLLSSSYFVDAVISHSVGVSYPAINASALVGIKVPLPPIPEQQTISTFLDRETTKIDELIAEQQRLIELLKEKRLAVISNSITKGLNPDTPMKDSGIAWLGEVPEHWSLPKLKHFTSFAGGGTPSRDNLKYWNGDIPWVSPKDMKTEIISGAEEYITQTGLENSSSSLRCAGCVLVVVRSGILKHTIPVAINEVPVALNQDMKALSFADGSCLSMFFLRWVQGLNNLLLLVWAKQGATVESIEHSYMAETVIPLPPITEQQTIVAFLDYELSKFDDLTTEAQAAITLLQERRTSLISAAVTGKIDVRGLIQPNTSYIKLR